MASSHGETTFYRFIRSEGKGPRVRSGSFPRFLGGHVIQIITLRLPYLTYIFYLSSIRAGDGRMIKRARTKENIIFHLFTHFQIGVDSARVDGFSNRLSCSWARDFAGDSSIIISRHACAPSGLCDRKECSLQQQMNVLRDDIVHGAINHGNVGVLRRVNSRRCRPRSSRLR